MLLGRTGAAGELPLRLGRQVGRADRADVLHTQAPYEGVEIDCTVRRPAFAQVAAADVRVGNALHRQRVAVEEAGRCSLNLLPLFLRHLKDPEIEILRERHGVPCLILLAGGASHREAAGRDLAEDHLGRLVQVGPAARRRRVAVRHAVVGQIKRKEGVLRLELRTEDRGQRHVGHAHGEGSRGAVHVGHRGNVTLPVVELMLRRRRRGCPADRHNLVVGGGCHGRGGEIDRHLVFFVAVDGGHGSVASGHNDRCGGLGRIRHRMGRLPPVKLLEQHVAGVGCDRHNLAVGVAAAARAVHDRQLVEDRIDLGGQRHVGQRHDHVGRSVGGREARAQPRRVRHGRRINLPIQKSVVRGHRRCDCIRRPLEIITAAGASDDGQERPARADAVAVPRINNVETGVRSAG